MDQREKKTNIEVTSLYLSKDLIAELKKCAKAQNRSLSFFVREILKDKLKNNYGITVD